MKTTLYFKEREISLGEPGGESALPDLWGNSILQNQVEFHLSEEEEIYQGWGRRTTSFPYRQQNSYRRTLSKRKISTAVLENAHIRAVFLPSLGGRLWELWDKKENRNLLYTNDVIRFSNLAIRNAWFSGGVEWNLGLIGHTPFTAAPLHTAVLDSEYGPVLRMYEFEPVRGVEYQMDFFLREDDTFLNCRMRILNSGKDVVPMYWWSNMAVPEYAGGRIAVPADSAYTQRGNGIYKKDIPFVDGVDISRCPDIPNQVDYFFDLPEDAPKYIANLDANGYGLFHLSTKRLRGRKLFSWGHNRGSKRWQQFLTEDAGSYVEIQAGLGKTQYGCLPMAPNTAWEWLEQYGPVRVSKELQSGEYGALRRFFTAFAKEQGKSRQIEELLRESKTMAKTPGETVQSGSTLGAFEQGIRCFLGEPPLSEHLAYGKTSAAERDWLSFLTDGVFPERAPSHRPDLFTGREIFYRKLRETVCTVNRENWYAHYQLGICALQREQYEEAKEALERSAALAENLWAYHALAVLALLAHDKKAAASYAKKAWKLCTGDLGCVKELLKILLAAGAYRELLAAAEELPAEIASDSRIVFDRMTALAALGETEQAKALLTDDFVLDDIRECDGSIDELWQTLYGGTGDDVPDRWCFRSV